MPPLEHSENSTLSHQLDPAQFGKALFESAIQNPYNSLTQIAKSAGLSVPEMHLVSDVDHNTVAAKAGSLVGFAADMTLLSRGVGKALEPGVGKLGIESGIGKSALNLGLSGGIYGGLLTETDRNSGQLAQRLKNSAVDGLSFAAMGGASEALGRTRMFAGDTLNTKIALNAVAGAGGGIVEAQSRSLLDGRGFADSRTTFDQAATYAAFGGAFGAAGHVLDSLAAIKDANRGREAGSSLNVYDGLTTTKLQAAFGEPLVRVRLRWDLLHQMDAPVSTHVIVDQQGLSNLMHPWFTGKNGEVVGWNSVDARPLSVTDVAKHPELVPNERVQHIQEVGNELSALSSPVQVTALGYELPGGKHLLLDSNHRIAGLAAQNIPFRLILHSIRGPLDGRYLPDLVQYSPEAAKSPAAKQQAIQDVMDANGWN